MSFGILVDTNVIINVLKKGPALLFELQKETNWLGVSTVSICELYAMPGMSDSEEKDLKATIECFKVISFDHAISEKAGLLARTRPNRRKRADLMIAATALNLNYDLMTFNTKDFSGIPNLKILEKEKLGL